MAKVLIVEDEVLIARQLIKYLNSNGHECIGHATSYEEALEQFKSIIPDIVLIDIRLYGEKSGIELAKYINENHPIPFIYLTSHFEKGTLEEAKKTRPAGYLTKPYHQETLLTTIEVCLFNSTNVSKITPNIIIQEGKKTHLFSSDEIIYIEADHVYSRIYLLEQTMLLRKSLNDLTSSLPANKFIRVHKSFIVNIKQIKQVSSSFIIINDVKIPVGKKFREEVIKTVNT
jgi:two-component system, LytTR family, response regulator LytT